MIKKIKDSLTIKIFILIAVLLIAASSITYAVISGFLPAYYSSRLEQDLDIVSQEMAETISSHETLEDAFSAIELFEAGSQASVVILDAQGSMVWPTAGLTTVAEQSAAVEYDVIEEYTIREFATEDPVDGESAGTGGTGEVTREPQLLYDGYAEDIMEKSEVNSAVQHYDLKVGNQDYIMIVSGGMQPVNQAMEILYQIFPYILGISAVIAVLFAIAASLYLTAPVVSLSRISKNMAALDFEDRYQGKRTDEIGILGRNLNELSSGLSCTLRELKMANEKLRSDIEMERELEKKRIAFFSAVSHELKTPITILKGHLSGMLQGIGEYRNRDYYLQRSRQTAEKMEVLVQELLTISRIENNSFIRQETDVAEQLRQQLADLTELMEEKGIELAAELPEHLTAEVNAGMMEKVWGNLLMNAICYTPQDEGNQIRVVLKEGMPGSGKFFCLIENTGVSIPEEDLTHLYEAFYRVEQSRNRRTGGSGLGLYIVRMVLEQHGAVFNMENTKEGVRFSFSV